MRREVLEQTAVPGSAYQAWEIDDGPCPGYVERSLAALCAVTA